MESGHNEESIPTPPELEVKLAPDRTDIAWVQHRRSYLLTLDPTAITIQSERRLFERRIRYSVPRSAIEGVFVVERQIGRYELHLVNRDRQSRKIPAEILGGDLELNVALYLKMTIEQFFNLEMKHVAGETETEPRYRTLPNQHIRSLWNWSPVSQYSDGILAGASQQRSTVVMPEGYEVTHYPDAMTIACPCKKIDEAAQGAIWLGLLFAGFLLLIIWGAGSLEALAALVLSVLMLFIILLPKMVPYLFRHRITLDTSEMLITSGPSLLRSKGRIETRYISQLYVVEHAKEVYVPWGLTGPPALTYHLIVLGPYQGIIAECEDAHAALFLEHELEKFLKIEDKPVQGELKSKYRW